jgi:branched-chain amino acid transport system ATP-binding protein
MSTLLQARQLSAGYHGQPVVRDLDLVVKAGEVVALVGANGAGKTTTLNTFAGFVPLLSGTVEYEGVATSAAPNVRARAGLALVPEGRSVFPRLTTRDNLRVGRCDTAMVLELFPELRPLLKRQAGLLSGGEQQMLALGRALARSPKVLLADELSLGLAPMIVSRLLQAVRRVATEGGVGALLVEQHVEQAMQVADRVYVLRRGKVAVAGTVAEVRPHLRAAYLSDPGAA